MKADNTLDKELADKCFSVFNIIKDNNVEDYLALYVQSPTGENEKDFLIKQLNNRHEWYVNKHSGWKSLNFKYVEYQNSRQTDVEKYSAEKIAYSFFSLVMNDEKEIKVSTQCKFAKVKDKWFLTKLP